MNQIAQRILNLFEEMNTDTLDLHTMFEAGGNDPSQRERVVDEIAQLVQHGLLLERGSDFYQITPKGRAAFVTQ